MRPPRIHGPRRVLRLPRHAGAHGLLRLPWRPCKLRCRLQTERPCERDVRPPRIHGPRRVLRLPRHAGAHASAPHSFARSQIGPAPNSYLRVQRGLGCPAVVLPSRQLRGNASGLTRVRRSGNSLRSFQQRPDGRWPDMSRTSHNSQLQRWRQRDCHAERWNKAYALEDGTSYLGFESMYGHPIPSLR